MGLDYEYNLFFPREKIWNVLEDLGRNAKIVDGRQIDIILPNRRVNLPFTSDFKSEPIQVDESTETLHFDTSLYFEPDSEIEQYVLEQEKHLRGSTGFDEKWIYPRDEQGRVSIGYIYLYLRLKSSDMPNYIYLSFTSATTRMGTLFITSPSIHRTFIRLLEAHNGICAYIADSDCLSLEYIYPANCDVDKARELLQ